MKRSLSRAASAAVVAASLSLSGCIVIDADVPATVRVASAEAAPRDPYQPRPMVQLNTPEWAKDAVIYQINTRQFTPEGTFRAAQRELPRLKAMGVDILWLMPIHPIGEKNRKGTLGSPYSVRDYRAVNPEFGTAEDFKAFVDAAHAQGMHVILDWVANHTAWDNWMVEAHPEWYERDLNGAFHPTPWWDWSDIIDLNYDNAGLRRYMTESMAYWVREYGVDGFRADVAGYVPLDFWETTRAELDKIRPVFMLAETNARDVHYRAFEASYAWNWAEAMTRLAKREADTGALYGYYSENESLFPREAMRLVYTSNHDQNAWEATEFERYGQALEMTMVMSFVGEGIPSIYNGQEAGNTDRLAFFERDPIQWREHPNGAFLAKLIQIKTDNPALWNGRWGGRMHQVLNSDSQKVFSFVRRAQGNQVFAVFNFSDQPRTVNFTSAYAFGAYRDVFSGAPQTVDANTRLTVPAWGYRVFSRKE